MKVLIVNGSPRKNGNCARLIKEMEKVFDELNVACEEMLIGGKAIRGCAACLGCRTSGKCVLGGEVVEAAEKLKECDGLIVVSPTYYGSPNGTLISFLDRLFYSSASEFKMKVGAAFAVARRAGTVASFDVLNKYFTISGMPVVSGDYWNNGFGREPGEIAEDKEGLRNARVVARRMVFLMNAIKEAKEKYPELLIDEPRTPTSFIK